MTKINRINKFLKVHGPTITLFVMLVVFTAYAGFMALNLQKGIIPDEPAHFIFSKYFATTFGIPPDTYETYSWGWYIEGHPFLYYWINGRIINLISIITPDISDTGLLISLRVVSVFFGILTIVFCFLLSKEVTQHQWWQLLPVFLLTNTLMFVFISAGVHYDNLANLFSMVALYFLVRVLKCHNFLTNSFAWMITIAIATLVKYPILPLALAMFITWLIFLLTHRKDIFPIKVIPLKTLALSLMLVPLIIGNFAIYGINLIKYQSITPPCREILLKYQCEISKYEQRHRELALDSKLTIAESISEGYPTPLRYTFIDWVYHILLRTFGLSGHKAYFPYHLIPYYQLLFYLVVILGLLNLFLWRSFSFIEINLLGIAAFYTLVLFFNNYNSELVYGFRQVAVQGRYLFPVVGIIVILFTKIIKQTPIRFLQGVTLTITIGLIFWGGPLTLLLKFNTVFFGWFM